ncbi:hypothetical protein F5Y16DRAFT_369086 [Xylariaceae sp. FL0255]|nr:hypothetical protein F5Y16DRAFT_369086 [Xylariaceae sp. FL0255]
MPTYTDPPTSGHGYYSHGNFSKGGKSGPRSDRKRSPSPDSQDKANAVLKTSLVFLGAVGAASLVAHKYWPKGVIYGDMEEQEEKKEEKKQKKEDREDRAERKEDKRSRGGPTSERNRRAQSQNRSSQASGGRARSRHDDIPVRREYVYENDYPPRPRSFDQRRLVEIDRREYLEELRATSPPRTRVYVDDHELIGRPRVMAYGGVRREYDYA